LEQVQVFLALRMQESRFFRSSSSPVAQMEAGFANTLVLEMGADNASRIRVAE
jgi:hypothetical protein